MFRATTPRLNRAIVRIQRTVPGETIAGVGGTRSFGATITHALLETYMGAVEAKNPRRKINQAEGRPDEIDAATAALNIMPRDVAKLLH